MKLADRPTPETNAAIPAIFYGVNGRECKRDSTEVMSVYIDDWQKMHDTAQSLERRLAHAVEALNSIASWKEGELVNSLFDEPHSAASARQALSEIAAAQEGRVG